MNKPKPNRDTDFDLLTRIKALAWLSCSERSRLADALETANFRRHEMIFSEAELAAKAHLLLNGVGSITCSNSRGQRITVSLLAPGPIPEFPTLGAGRYRFQCEAFTDCRTGSVSWQQFNELCSNAPFAAMRTFHQNNLKQWYRLLLRGSSFLNLHLHERIAIALLELCNDFGIEDSRGTLLRINFSHKDLANLVGASRPRVTEHLAQLERERMVIRQGRQLVVCGELGSQLYISSYMSRSRQRRPQWDPSPHN